MSNLEADKSSATYKLNSLTNLCSKNGVNNVEFRITEIKSAMRFWWRALGNYENIKEMFKEERMIFGNSEDFKSPIIFKLISLDYLYDKKMEHTIGKGRKIPCIHPEISAEIKLDIVKRKFGDKIYPEKSLDFYRDLLNISLILGGVGMRSRRGCGCFLFGYEDVSNINERIKILMENLDFERYYDFSGNDDNNFFIKRKANLDFQYPYVEEICVGKKFVNEDQLYKKIKNAIDKTRESELEYKVRNSGRLACPVYVTCYGKKDELYPIIVKLYNTKYHKKDKAYYDKFKEEIL